MIKRIKKSIEVRKISRGSLRWIHGLTAPYQLKISALILLRSLTTAIGIGMAIINKQIVDLATAALDITWMVIIAIGSTALTLVISIVLSMLSIRVTERYAYHVRSSMYGHILRSTWADRTIYHSEELLSRLTSDVHAVTDGVISVQVSIVSTIVQFIMAFIVLWHYDWTLAMVAAVTGPLIALFSFIVSRKLRTIQINLQQTEADYRVYLQEQISHADVIKAFELERYSLDHLDVLQQNRMDWVLKRNHWTLFLRGGISGMFSGTYLFAFISSALKIATGTITYGTMTAFLSLVGQVQVPVYSMSQILGQAISVLASASRLMEITDFREEEAPSERITKSSAIGIKIENVSFAYGDKPILDNFSAIIEAGSLAAIMGPSGIGKTTLVRILLGFMTVPHGQVNYVIDGGVKIPCSAMTRRYLSYVPQGNTLFSGTIADNLRMGDPAATSDDMIHALEMACAWDFVSKLPEGIGSQIGEKAHGLSEGQAQRIAIARAIIRRTPLLILDEATSALDAKTERAILHNLRTSAEKRTYIIISHRKTVKEFADQVITIEQCRVDLTTP